MMKKKRKIIFGMLLLLVACATLSPAYTYADDKDDAKCKKYVEEHGKSFADKYGLKLESETSDEGAQFVVLSMNIPKDSDLTAEEKKQAEFKIAKIEIGRVGDEAKKYINGAFSAPDEIQRLFSINNLNIKNGQKITIPHNSASSIGYHITLEPVNFSDRDINSYCGDGAKFSVEVNADVFEQPAAVVPDDVTAKFNELDKKYAYLFTDSNNKKIDCGNISQYAENSIERKYCDIYNRIPEGKMQTIGAAGIKQPDKFQCKYDKNLMFNSQEFLKDNQADEYYSKSGNTEYMGAKKVENIELDNLTYKYHYIKKKMEKEEFHKNGMEESEPLTCEKTCTEVVKVEYGAPVASKAGLCFQYKVRVTSYVNCEITKEPKAPEDKYKVCNPVPACAHDNGQVITAAGPNEDFNACVDECDGGEFTSECSTKCYQEVYGNTSKKTSYSSTGELKAEKTKTKKKKESKKTAQQLQDEEKNRQRVYSTQEKDASKKPSSSNDTQEQNFDHVGDGLYLFDGKTITWSPATNLARYYLATSDWKDKWTFYRCAKKKGQGGGILSACGCGATCKWTAGDCGKKNKKGELVFKKYANPSYMAIDKETNLETYAAAKEKCNSEAVCSTTAAEFEISVDYKYGTGREDHKPIHFPYTENNAANKVTIQNQAEGKAFCVNPGGTDNRIINDAQGCYANPNCTIKEYNNAYSANTSSKMYLTEWTFPGTYQHVKTGEITYNKPENFNDKVWIAKANKYCIPLDQIEVNKKWWDAYYEQIVNTSRNKLDYSVTNASNVDVCKEVATNNTNTSDPNAQTPAPEEWNIKASTNNFGYFGWKINIECFYAIGKAPMTSSTTITDGDGKQKSCLNPSEEQMKIRTVDLENLFPGDEDKTTSENKTGRSPGFNWTKYSRPQFTESSTDNELSYSSQIQPDAYLQFVQKNKYTIYNDEELDYDITLTKDQITQLRKKMKDDKDYTKFEGNNSKVDSAIHYESNLWTSGLVKDNRRPHGDAIKCNNLTNKATNCSNIEDLLKK